MSATFGKYTYMSTPPKIINYGDGTKVVIGKFCSIADNCTIYLGGNHRTDWVTTYPFGHIHKKHF